MNSSHITEFIHDVMSELLTGQTTEHSFRPAFKKLFSHIDKIKSVNEPKYGIWFPPLIHS